MSVNLRQLPGTFRFHFKITIQNTADMVQVTNDWINVDVPTELQVKGHTAIYIQSSMASTDRQLLMLLSFIAAPSLNNWSFFKIKITVCDEIMTTATAKDRRFGKKTMAEKNYYHQFHGMTSSVRYAGIFMIKYMMIWSKAAAVTVIMKKTLAYYVLRLFRHNRLQTVCYRLSCWKISVTRMTTRMTT